MLKPLDYLSGLQAHEVRYLSLHYDDYYHMPYPAIENQKREISIVVGINNGRIPSLKEIENGKSTYRDFIKELPIEMNHELMSRYIASALSHDEVRVRFARHQGTTIQEQSLNDYSVLCEFLSMWEMCGQIEGFISLSIEGVIALCNKYGLPLYVAPGESASERLIATGDIHVSVPQMDESMHFGFYVDRFASELLKLYSLYLIWLYLWYEDESVLHRDEFRLFIDTQNPEKGNQSPADTSMRSLVLRKLFLSSDYSVYTKTFLVPDGKGGVSSANQTDTLLAALKAQLLDLVVNGGHILNGRMIYSCDNCGKSFIRKHKNAKLCENCRTNASKLKKHRTKKKREKEAATNAEKER